MLTEKDYLDLTKLAETKKRNFRGLIRWIVPFHSHLKHALENTDPDSNENSFKL